ncbi:MAG: flagellar hook-basal body complex protein FliE [Burkholderiaceae bacterium]|nr:flagellar hook-basal body complex protein FliE [Burkholderiaceae bacterium]
MDVDARPIDGALAQAVARLRKATPAAAAQGGGDFLASLQSALASVSRAQNAASELQRQFQLENPNVSLEETMIAMNKAQIAFAAALQVRNRLVQAYEQIMNMPV